MKTALLTVLTALFLMTTAWALSPITLTGAPTSETIVAAVPASDGHVMREEVKSPVIVETAPVTVVDTTTKVTVDITDVVSDDIEPAPVVEPTPYYKTREGHDEASRRTLSGEFPVVRTRELWVNGRKVTFNEKGQVVDNAPKTPRNHSKKQTKKAKTPAPAAQNFSKAIDRLNQAVFGKKDQLGVEQELAEIRRTLNGDSKNLGLVKRVEKVEYENSLLRGIIYGDKEKAVVGLFGKVFNVEKAIKGSKTISWIAILLVIGIIIFLIYKSLNRKEVKIAEFDLFRRRLDYTLDGYNTRFSSIEERLRALEPPLAEVEEPPYHLEEEDMAEAIDPAEIARRAAEAEEE